MARWRYLLMAMVVASWLALHLLFFIPEVRWFENLFKISWITLFFLTLVAPFFRRWREAAISCLVLFVTFSVFAVLVLRSDDGPLIPNKWVQALAFRPYIAHRLNSMTSAEFLSRCQTVDYVGEDGTNRKIGECTDGLRATLLFRIFVVYDPSGEIALPSVERSPAWRLAVGKLPSGSSFESFFSFADEAPGERVAGDFYWVLARGPL